MYAIFANICFGLMFIYGKCRYIYHTIGSDAYSAISGHEIKPFELDIFPTKYGIPKSLKPVSHWLSEYGRSS